MNSASPAEDTDEARVGIIIAACNAGRFIGQALESVRSQTFKCWRCVVVDDGSTDDTPHVAGQMALSDGRIEVHRRENRGVGAARNWANRRLPETIEFLCFVDSDDVLVPDALESLVEVLDVRADAVGVSGWAETIDERGCLVAVGRHRRMQTDRVVGAGLRVRHLRTEEDTTFESLIIQNSVWPPATAVLRRMVFDEVGGFDEQLVQAEDWDLLLRMARRGPLAQLDKQVARYRKHPGNVTNKEAENRYWQNVVVEKAWRSSENVAAQRRAVHLSWARGLAFHAYLELIRLAASVRARRLSEIGPRILLIGSFAFRLIGMVPRRMPWWLAVQEARLEDALNRSENCLVHAGVGE